MINAIIPPGAPSPVGPYSPGMVSSPFVFTSGQIGLDSTGQLVNATFEDEVRQVLSNLKGVLEAGGSGLPHLIKTTVYLTDLSLFDRFNRVYESMVTAPFPARTTIQVSALPKGATIEIEGIGAIPHR